MENVGLLALFGLLLVKESGIPIPIPGDLLVLGAGVAAARGDVPPLAALVVVLLAGLLGGLVQFALLRGTLRRRLLRLLGRFGVAEDRIERYAERLRHRGARGVALARMTPGVRVVAIAASALAALPTIPFLLGLALGNGVFVGGHFALGLLLGEPAIRLVSALAAPLTIVAILLAAVGIVVWLLVASRRRAPGAPKPPAGLAVLSWADASCPACLALGVIGERRDR